MDQETLHMHSLVQFARDFGPTIAAAAEEIDSIRRIPQRIIDPLAEAGIFRMLQPKSIGGGEVHPRVFCEVIQTLAEANGSVGWLQMPISAAAVSAHMSDDAKRRVFATPYDLLAYGPPGAPLQVNEDKDRGGYLVTGERKFCSGIAHATWVGLLGNLPSGEPRLFVVKNKPEIVTIKDIWHTMGLRGTYSNDYSVTKAFVPYDLVIDRDSPESLTEKGPLAKIPAFLMSAIGAFSAGAGIFRGARNHFLDADRVRHGAKASMLTNPAVERLISTCEYSLDSVRYTLNGSIDQLWKIANDPNAKEIPDINKLKIQEPGLHIIHVARELTGRLFVEAGSEAIFINSPLGRCLRDLWVLGQQYQASVTQQENFGRAHVGMHRGDPNAFANANIGKPPAVRPG